MALATRTVDAQNEFTDGIEVGVGRDFTARIADLSSFAGTITIQAKKDNELDSAYSDVESFVYASDWIKIGEFLTPGWYVRIGCKTGDYTSGSITVTVYS